MSTEESSPDPPAELRFGDTCDLSAAPPQIDEPSLEGAAEGPMIPDMEPCESSTPPEALPSEETLSSLPNTAENLAESPHSDDCAEASAVPPRCLPTSGENHATESAPPSIESAEVGTPSTLIEESVSPRDVSTFIEKNETPLEVQESAPHSMEPTEGESAVPMTLRKEQSENFPEANKEGEEPVTTVVEKNETPLEVQELESPGSASHSMEPTEGENEEPISCPQDGEEPATTSVEKNETPLELESLESPESAPSSMDLPMTPTHPTDCLEEQPKTSSETRISCSRDGEEPVTTSLEMNETLPEESSTEPTEVDASSIANLEEQLENSLETIKESISCPRDGEERETTSVEENENLPEVQEQTKPLDSAESAQPLLSSTGCLEDRPENSSETIEEPSSCPFDCEEPAENSTEKPLESSESVLPSTELTEVEEHLEHSSEPISCPLDSDEPARTSEVQGCEDTKPEESSESARSNQSEKESFIASEPRSPPEDAVDKVNPVETNDDEGTADVTDFAPKQDAVPGSTSEEKVILHRSHSAGSRTHDVTHCHFVNPAPQEEEAAMDLSTKCRHHYCSVSSRGQAPTDDREQQVTPRHSRIADSQLHIEEEESILSDDQPRQFASISSECPQVAMCHCHSAGCPALLQVGRVPHRTLVEGPEDVRYPQSDNSAWRSSEHKGGDSSTVDSLLLASTIPSMEREPLCNLRQASISEETLPTSDLSSLPEVRGRTDANETVPLRNSTICAFTLPSQSQTSQGAAAANFSQSCSPGSKKKTGGIDLRQLFNFLTPRTTQQPASMTSSATIQRTHHCSGSESSNSQRHSDLSQLSFNPLPETSSCSSTAAPPCFNPACSAHFQHSGAVFYDPKCSDGGPHNNTSSSAADAILRRFPTRRDYHLPTFRIFRQNRKADVEQIKRWRKSFDHLLSDPCGLNLFHTYLKSEYSQENIQFWIACEEYKDISSTKKMNKEAQRIYTNFLSIQAPQEINLDSKTRIQTIAAVSNPNKRTFENAQKKIHALMEKDSYPRFLRSEIYQNALRDALAHENE